MKEIIIILTELQKFIDDDPTMTLLTSFHHQATNKNSIHEKIT